MEKYKLRVKPNQEPPEEWSRVLVPFADGGLRIIDTFIMECIVEISPITLGYMEPALRNYVDFIPYKEGEHTDREVIMEEREKAYNWWKTS